ncbi:hypothetical protein NM688_g7975 [Phlebia brevispora]|uniref:Uncharacterized protein n=1 Tax=Phlebia brevispora TaxID=194682 RepID=A0ACC1RZI2_9APHY|nr:hypothetical protein NM688_g7975 [Phlebia brevispora]
MSANLHHLPLSTQSRLRSSQILTSLPQVVSELVQNSLDAGASRVEVGVDCEEWLCWVQDDGRGMSKSDLTDLVSVGRYSTSKAYSPASLEEVTTFGFRGEALASIADLCCLEISSRTQRSRECWSVISKGGEVLYNGPAVRWRRESPGTVVCVRDMFYNLPVRRRSHPSAARTLELVRKELEALALVSPQVSFSLENTNRASRSRPDRGRVMAVPKARGLLRRRCRLFDTFLANGQNVEEIHTTSGSVTADGFISLEGAPSRAYQYLYVNRHLLAPCELHRIIDTLFASSSFARDALDEYMQSSQPLYATRRSPKKPDKKPIYVLNITIPPQQVDNCLEPAKTAVQLQNTDAVTSLLSSVVHAFLVKHGFKTDKDHEHGQRNMPSHKRRKLEASHSAEFTTASSSRVPSSARARTVPLSRSQTPNVLPEVRLTLFKRSDVLSLCGMQVNPTAETEGEFRWTDPRTGETFSIDSRTGNSYRVDDRRDDGPSAGSARRTLASRPSFIKDSAVVEAAEEGETPQWIQEALGVRPHLDSRIPDNG